ncbi:hypothetical protein ACIQC5_05380 [Paenarthrobacter sp. NPDC092416]|uniref:hypothetical protein n=1 Tax=Paenarthrobacter sp. NPDC092416 TaxID=3364386 RepID=UPI0037FA3793
MLRGDSWLLGLSTQGRNVFVYRLAPALAEFLLDFCLMFREVAAAGAVAVVYVLS